MNASTCIHDNAKEFTNNLNNFCKEKGIIYNFSPPYTHESNGGPERINRTLLNKIRSIIFTANIPLYLWGEILLSIVEIYNKTPHSSIKYKCPIEEKDNIVLKLEDYENIRTIGSIIYYKNKNPTRKLETRAYKGIIIGFYNNSKIYKIWDYKKHKLVISRDVIILENIFLNKDNKEALINKKDLQENLNNNKKETFSVDIPKKPTEYYKAYKEIPSLIALIIENNIIEPYNYNNALNSLEKEKWITSMKDEIQEILIQKTFLLSYLPKDRKALKGRWVYKLKTDSNNNIIKYKSRWVIQGFNQVLNLDFTETFATTSRPETIKILLITAVRKGYYILQYDIKNAFIHADIDEEIYTIFPIGFKEFIINFLINNNLINKEIKENINKINKEELVLKLNKALYGLKQSPRLWYNFLANLLNKLGFIPMPYDEGIFINNSLKIAIICHVDDLIFIGPSDKNIYNIINNLSKDIKIQPLGEIKDFLGMNIFINRDKKSIYISQSKYIKNILIKYNKTTIGTSKIPAIAGEKLIKAKIESSKEDILEFQKEIGSLLYPAIKTRPDIAYSVINLSRFMSKPDNSHFKALDLIWKYLNNNQDLGLYYNCDFSENSLNNIIRGYSDASWASNIEDRKSVNGYCFYLFNNLISWNSSKQKCVSTSTCEAEYIALREAVKEAKSLNNIYKYINNKLSLSYNKTIPPVLTDNEAARQLAENSSYYKKSKHIDIAYHFTRDEVKKGNIKLFYIKSKDNIADFFTKSLGPIEFLRLRNYLSLEKYTEII